MKTAWSQVGYQRNVEFEWEDIDGAKSYELEFQQGTKVLKFKTNQPIWAGPLKPGIYNMRLRAKDKRGVPGDWSPPEEFKVGLETPQIISPAPQAKIKTEENEKSEVAFNWKTVGGAEKYEFEINSHDGTFSKKEVLSENKISLTLIVAKKYKWKIKAIGMNTESDNAAIDEFTLFGKKIDAPELQKPENDFVREIKWTQPEFAGEYNLVIKKYNNRIKKWENIETIPSHKQTTYVFNPRWTGGKYRFQLIAKSDLRPDSDMKRMDFQVRSGDRSPAAEEVATVRQSIERLSGWYGIASYLVTSINYSGIDPSSRVSTPSYDGIGGTGRLGLGYLSAKNPWGFIGIVDLGGMTDVYNRTFTYASTEFNAVYRTSLGDRSELRQQIGLFYKEIPEYTASVRIEGGQETTSVNPVQYLNTLGPHYGFEFWYAFNPKLGFQFNSHFYPSIVKVKTPNGRDLVPTLSYQFGIMGSYRIISNITGLAGYAYRQDTASYKSSVTSGSLAKEGDVNTAILKGHYLNLFLEWAL